MALMKIFCSSTQTADIHTWCFWSFPVQPARQLAACLRTPSAETLLLNCSGILNKGGFIDIDRTILQCCLFFFLMIYLILQCLSQFLFVVFFLPHFQDCTFDSSFKVQAQHLFALSLFSNQTREKEAPNWWTLTLGNTCIGVGKQNQEKINQK